MEYRPLLLSSGPGGSNSYVPADTADVDGDGNTTETLPLDLAGNARIQGTAVDMGAYEVK
jgi:hypothetical protein